MLRLARFTSPDLAKYYVFTGTPITAQDAYELGIVTKLVMPAEVETAIKELTAEGKPDKYRQRELPERLRPFALACRQDNVARLLSGNPPEGIPDQIAVKAAKFIGYKAPIALKLANEIIDQQAGKSMEDAIEVELNRCKDIFSTGDALLGLSNIGKRIEFKGA
jgi:enoyl-CoA hydratase/3-hydroxyacyl-CoA dehydrogenase